MFHIYTVYIICIQSYYLIYIGDQCVRNRLLVFNPCLAVLLCALGLIARVTVNQERSKKDGEIVSKRRVESSRQTVCETNQPVA